MVAMTDLRSQFGERLRSLRKQRGLTQESLAEALGVSVDLVSMIERGLRAPSFDTLERLADALSVRVSALFVFTESNDDSG
jgi:transcriptional regulator with XRE-family HTH domain